MLSQREFHTIFGSKKELNKETILAHTTLHIVIVSSHGHTNPLQLPLFTYIWRHIIENFAQPSTKQYQCFRYTILIYEQSRMIENYAESFNEIEVNGYERSSITHHGDFLK